MTYPYGMYNAPEVGNGLGGLPRRVTAGGPPTFLTFNRFVTPGSGVAEVPSGARWMRVTVVGGGGGAGNRGGGGGGCATTSTFVSAASVTYSVGAGGTGAGGGNNGNPGVPVVLLGAHFL